MSSYFCPDCRIEHWEFAHSSRPENNKDHWYKTSPHDDRWGSFNPLNMDWWSRKLMLGCGFYLLLVLVAGCEAVVEWVT